MSSAQPDLDSILGLVRPEVRRERAYAVGGAVDLPVKLNQNESPFDLPTDLKRKIVDAIFEIPFNRYPTEQPTDLCRTIAAGLSHPPEGILIGNGSNELTYTVGLSFIAPGVRVVLPRPMFSLYGTMVRLHGGTVVSVGPRPDLSFDVDAIVSAVTRQNPALTVVATPNNPTGLAISIQEIERILDSANGLVLIDEAYVEFNPYGSALGLLDRYPNLLILRTLSKAVGLAGLRVGYLVGHPDLVAEMLKARLPFMVDRLSQAAAQAVLARPDLLQSMIEQIRHSTTALTDGLEALPGVEVLRSATNFVLFRTPIDPSVLSNRLAAAGVMVRSLASYPELRPWLRVSAGTPDEDRLFLHALQAALSTGE